MNEPDFTRSLWCTRCEPPHFDPDGAHDVVFGAFVQKVMANSTYGKAGSLAPHGGCYREECQECFPPGGFPYPQSWRHDAVSAYPPELTNNDRQGSTIARVVSAIIALTILLFLLSMWV